MGKGEVVKETAGAAAYRLGKGLKDDKHTAVDQGKENLKNYEANIMECIKTNKNKLHCDFFLVVLTKREQIAQNIMRKQYFARMSCPTPTYDQTVYSYNYADDSLEFLWVLPPRETVFYMRDNPSEVNGLGQIQLLKYVYQFLDGTLDHMTKRLNNETKNSIIIES